MISRYLMLLVIINWWANSYAQDVHFSQFGLSPLTLNPALAGDSENGQRFIINYKNQWESIGSTYRTYSASYDLALMKNKLGGRYIGIGVSAYSDKAGKSEFGNTEAQASIAYNLLLNKKQELSFAIRFGYGQRSAQLTTLRWDSQYTGSNYDPNLPSGEEALDQQTSFLDLGAGVLWRNRGSGEYEWRLGASAFHLNTPNISLIGTSEDIYLMKYVLHGEVRIGEERYRIVPSFFVAKQGGAREINVGGMVQRRFGQDSRYTRENTSSSAYLGLFYRVNDALIPTMLFEFKRSFSIGISYDVNTSRLSQQTNYRGGVELAIAYHRVLSDSRRKLKSTKVVK